MPENIPPTLHPPRCSRLAWCRNPHPPAEHADRDHVGLFGDLSESGFTLEISAWQHERGGQLVGRPAVRIIYGPDPETGDTERDDELVEHLPRLDLTPEQAGHLVEILRLLPWPGAGVFRPILADAVRAVTRSDAER